MSCDDARPTFRLLDPIGGWEEADVQDLAFTDAGLTLADSRPGLSAITADEVQRRLLPGHLAHDGCGRWYLAHEGRVLTLGPCGAAFGPLDPPLGAVTGAVAVAAAGPVSAVLLSAEAGVDVDADAEGPARTRAELLVVDDGGRRIIARVPLPWTAVEASAVGVGGPAGQPDVVLVAGSGASPGTGLVIALDLLGRELRRWLVATPDRIVALGAVRVGGDPPSDGADGADPQLVAVTAANERWRELWLLPLGQEPEGRVVAPLPTCRLGPPGDGLCATVSESGFCLGPAGSARCFDRGGAAIAADGAPGPGGAPRKGRGWLVTGPIDGGHDQARWRRVQVEADVPDGTTVGVDVCVVADPHQVPGSDDWEPVGQLDGLIRLQPPGRLLRLRVRLAGDGTATPTVARLRIDLDTRSTAAALPAVYLEDPPAAEFTDRFVALFDAVIGELDSTIAASSILFDPEHLRDELLPGLLTAVGLPDAPGWDATQRRDLLRRAGALLAERGTPAGLVDVVRTVYGVTVEIDERGADRPWGLVGRSRLGTTRLVARSRAAARIGVSALGEARVDSFAQPEAGAFSSGAHRVTIRVPHQAIWADQRQRQALQSLIRAWAPAELELSVQFSTGRFQLGGPLRLGVDTSLGGLPAGVLGGSGDHAVRLGRSSVVGRRQRFIGQPTIVGVRSNLGLNTTVG